MKSIFPWFEKSRPYLLLLLVASLGRAGTYAEGDPVTVELRDAFGVASSDYGALSAFLEQPLDCLHHDARSFSVQGNGAYYAGDEKRETFLSKEGTQYTSNVGLILETPLNPRGSPTNVIDTRMVSVFRVMDAHTLVYETVTFYVRFDDGRTEADLPPQDSNPSVAFPNLRATDYGRCVLREPRETRTGIEEQLPLPQPSVAPKSRPEAISPDRSRRQEPKTTVTQPKRDGVEKKPVRDSATTPPAVKRRVYQTWDSAPTATATANPPNVPKAKPSSVKKTPVKARTTVSDLD